MSNIKSLPWNEIVDKLSAIVKNLRNKKLDQVDLVFFEHVGPIALNSNLNREQLLTVRQYLQDIRQYCSIYRQQIVEQQKLCYQQHQQLLKYNKNSNL